MIKPILSTGIALAVIGGMTGCQPAGTPTGAKPTTGAPTAYKPAAPAKPAPSVAPATGQALVDSDYTITVPAAWKQITKNPHNASASGSARITAQASDQDPTAGSVSVFSLDADYDLSTMRALLDQGASHVMTVDGASVENDLIDPQGNPIGFAYKTPFEGKLLQGWLFAEAKNKRLYLVEIVGDINKFSENQALAIANTFELK